MILKAFTIYDNKALNYHSPFYAPADGAALRSFQEVCNDPNTSIGRHPGDYSLWCCGTFDDSNGHFEALIPLQHVVDALVLVKVQPPLPFPAAAQ